MLQHNIEGLIIEGPAMQEKRHLVNTAKFKIMPIAVCDFPAARRRLPNVCWVVDINETLAQCWLNVGPWSATLAQQ